MNIRDVIIVVRSILHLFIKHIFSFFKTVDVTVRDVTKGGTDGARAPPWGFQEAPGWNQGPVAEGRRGLNDHVGSEQSSHESQKITSGQPGPSDQPDS